MSDLEFSDGVIYPFSSPNWEVEDQGEYFDITALGETVARVPAWELSGDDAIIEARANAALIQNAPQMYKALSNMLPMFRKLYQEFDPDGEIAVWGEWFQMGIDALPDFDNMDEEIEVDHG